MDPRHESRIAIVQELYGETFVNQPKLHDKTKKVLENMKNLNAVIQKFAPKFPIDKISKVDLAILQLSVYELTIEKTEPPKVIINEAVELAREMGGEKTYSFVNAVLGKIYGKSIQGS
ncbi:MAG: transcription antitermination factor NusB [Patescibacteria group bacterium]